MLYTYTMPQKTVALKPDTLLRLKRLQLELTEAKTDARRVTMDDALIYLLDLRRDLRDSGE